MATDERMHNMEDVIFYLEHITETYTHTVDSGNQVHVTCHRSTIATKISPYGVIHIIK